MAKEVKDILQEIAEDTGIDPQWRLAACQQLYYQNFREDEETTSESDLEERLSKLEANVEEVLEVYSNLTRES